MRVRLCEEWLKRNIVQIRLKNECFFFTFDVIVIVFSFFILFAGSLFSFVVVGEFIRIDW